MNEKVIVAGHVHLYYMADVRYIQAPGRKVTGDENLDFTAPEFVNCCLPLNLVCFCGEGIALDVLELEFYDDVGHLVYF